MGTVKRPEGFAKKDPVQTTLEKARTVIELLHEIEGSEKAGGADEQLKKRFLRGALQFRALMQALDRAQLEAFAKSLTHPERTKVQLTVLLLQKLETN